MNSASTLVVDASVMVAFCAREEGRYERVEALLEDYAARQGRLYAPGVLIAEVLFALCRKLHAGDATTEQYRESLQAFDAYAPVILPPPGGDAALITRAEAIRNGYGCSHSADGLYIALAEILGQSTDAELATFDRGMARQALATAPNVTVRLLDT